MATTGIMSLCDVSIQLILRNSQACSFFRSLARKIMVGHWECSVDTQRKILLVKCPRTQDMNWQCTQLFDQKALRKVKTHSKYSEKGHCSVVYSVLCPRFFFFFLYSYTTFKLFHFPFSNFEKLLFWPSALFLQPNECSGDMLSKPDSQSFHIVRNYIWYAFQLSNVITYCKSWATS